MRRAAVSLLAAAWPRAAAGPCTPTPPCSPALAARLASSSTASGGPSTTTASASTSPPSSKKPAPPLTGDAALFSVVGRLSGRVPVKPRPVYAVVEISGTQYKVSPDDLIYTNQLDGAGVNDVLHLTRVLAVGTRTSTAVGRPTLAAAAVSAAVEEVGRDAKALSFWKRRRKASRRLRGHRQPITALRILDVLEGGVPVLETEGGGGGV